MKYLLIVLIVCLAVSFNKVQSNKNVDEAPSTTTGPPTTPPCVDKVLASFCSTLKKFRSCGGSLARKYCQKTCSKCPPPSTTTGPPTTPSCLDKMSARYCNRLVKSRDCSTARGRIHCKKTCRHCKPVTKPPTTTRRPSTTPALPCLDKLSAVQCKTAVVFNSCESRNAKYYCKKTCGHCTLPKQCRKYWNIHDKTRQQSRPTGVVQCDHRIIVGWYRLIGSTGTFIPNKCVPSNRCGTHASGWVNGNYPKIRGQTVTRQVCFSMKGNKRFKNDCCWRKVNIKITNCGDFYVFYLNKLLYSDCNYRYCGNY